MAKPLVLHDESTAPPVPRAAQTPETAPIASRPKRLPEDKREPLQVRWPAADVKAVKLAAIEQDYPTVSDFMLSCFHAYMKSRKQA
jgi:hypothetical protein